MSIGLYPLSTPFFTGAMTSAGLIVAIGAQNAFVLRQGVRCEYHWTIAGVCGLLDALLIVLGIAGMGVLISDSPRLLTLVTWAGSLFLLGYGGKALACAIRSQTLEIKSGGLGSRRSALLTTLALSLLNPHVYLDTLVLLGSIGGRYPDPDRYWFGAGASLFSFIWFFSLSLGARWLAPLFRKPIAWRVLDGLVCLMMWTLAWLLINGAIQ